MQWSAVLHRRHPPATHRDLVCLSLFFILFFTLFFLTGSAAAAVRFCFILRFLLTGVGAFAGGLLADAGDVWLLWADEVRRRMQPGSRARKKTPEGFPCEGLPLGVSYNKKMRLCGFVREW